MKAQKLFVSLFLILFSLIQTTKSVVIIVEGSLSATAKWYKPTGKCYKAIENTAKELNQEVIPFSWTGLQTVTQVIQGAEKLAQTILQYPNETVTIVGAEENTQVINFASQLLFNPLIDTALNPDDTSSLITQVYQDQALKISSSQAYNKYTHEVLTRAIENVTNLKKLTKNKTYWIDKVYLLSSSVETKNFAPHMNIIGEVYNFYSSSECTQKSYPKKDRLVNFAVTKDLAHTVIHDDIIAQWLLVIPEKLKEKGLGNFETFTNTGNGKIDFGKDKSPVYVEEGKSLEKIKKTKKQAAKAKAPASQKTQVNTKKRKKRKKKNTSKSY